jgi:hypothetical protein
MREWQREAGADYRRLLHSMNVHWFDVLIQR